MTHVEIGVKPPNKQKGYRMFLCMFYFYMFSWMDGETLDILTPKMVGSRPNTYTYTKSIAEYLLKEGGGSLPIAIFRPSIVGSTYQEPIAVGVGFI